MRLTEAAVTKFVAEPDASNDRFLWDAGDGAVKGFGVRLKPSGVASFLVQYRTREGATRRLVLGRVGTLPTKRALSLARQKLAEVNEGGDPSTERHRARGEALTIAELADLYLAEGPALKPNKKASSWATDRSNIERHVKPLLGRKLAGSLSQSEIAKFQADVAAGINKADVRTRQRGRAIVEGGAGTAARSLAVLSAMLQFAVNRKLIPANPAKGVPLIEGRKRERFLSGIEVAGLADTMAGMQAERVLSANAAAAIRLLLLTGCRKSEILGLRWEWVDLERGFLRLPDSKTGAKVVQLGAAALALLGELPRSSAFVLPAGRGAGHYTGLQKDWERVRARAGLPGVRVHDLRHSFASTIANAGGSLPMIAKLLGHRQTRTTARYAHLADDPVRALADQTAASIAAALTGAGK